MLRLLAAWALLHEGADDAWKAAVARGARAGVGGVRGAEDDGAPVGADAFADALAALVDAEKERWKAGLLGASTTAEASPGAAADLAAALESLRFEVAELRGCIESLQASVDALAARGD